MKEKGASFGHCLLELPGLRHNIFHKWLGRTSWQLCQSSRCCQSRLILQMQSSLKLKVLDSSGCSNHQNWGICQFMAICAMVKIIVTLCVESSSIPQWKSKQNGYIKPHSWTDDHAAISGLDLYGNHIYIIELIHLAQWHRWCHFWGKRGFQHVYILCVYYEMLGVNHFSLSNCRSCCSFSAILWACSSANGPRPGDDRQLQNQGMDSV